jgi:methyl-accepting chemotaxis protein
MKVSTRLLVAGIISSALIIINVAQGLFFAKKAGEAALYSAEKITDIARDKNVEVRMANTIMEETSFLAFTMIEIGNIVDSTERESRYPELDTITAKIQAAYDTLEVHIITGEGLRLKTEMSNKRKEIQTFLNGVYEYYKVGSMEEGKHLLETGFLKVLTPYLKACDELATYSESLAYELAIQVEEKSLESKEASKRYIFWAIILGIAVIGISFTLNQIISKVVVKRLRVNIQGAEELAKGNTNYQFDTEGKDEFAVLAKGMDTMSKGVNAIIDDVTQLTEQTAKGNLNARIEADKYEGEFKKIAEGLNSTVESIMNPFYITAEYVDRISKGDMPELITADMRGDFNEVKTNLNRCIESISMMIEDTNSLSDNIEEGNLSYRANAGLHQGAFAELMKGLNKSVDNLYQPYETAVNFLDAMQKGRASETEKIEYEVNGDYNKMKNAINATRDILFATAGKAREMTQAILDGRLDYRVDISDSPGAWKDVHGGYNSVVDAFMKPYLLAAEYIDRISKGDMPPMIVEEYKGDFNEIKTNINKCIDEISSLIKAFDNMTFAVQTGNLNDRIDDSLLHGDFKRLALGMNKSVDIFTGIFDKMDLMIFTADKNKKIRYMNDGTRSATGSSGNEMIGKASDEIFSGQVLCDLSNPEISSKLRNGMSYTDNALVKMNAGDYHVKYDISAVLDEDGEIIGLFEFLSNQTDIVKEQQKTEKISKYIESQIQRAIAALEEISIGRRLELTGERADKQSDPDLAESEVMMNRIALGIRGLIISIMNIRDDITFLLDNASKGILDQRADVSKHQNTYADMVGGLNNLLDEIAKPIDEAGTVLSAMATGDLTSKMDGNYEGKFAALKNDINQLSSSLNSMVSQVNETVETTASSAMEISSTAEILAASSQEMNSQADDVAAATEEMARTVTENAEGATSTAAMAMENATVAEEGGNVVKETVNKMADIAKVVEETASNIQKLGDSSKAIGEIVSVIDDIADQTNLLALNASIEAARAGEQGRGFAVVADEVRKLAEKTVDATKEIAGQISGIQRETEAAVKAMNIGTEEVENGMKLAQNAGDALEKVLSSSNEVTRMITDIAAASEQQAATTEEISKNVVGISHATAESTQQVESVAGTSDELAQLTNELHSLMAKFKVSSISGVLEG